MTYKQYKQKQAKEPANTSDATANGQGTLDGHLGTKDQQATNGAAHDTMDVEEDSADAGPEDNKAVFDGDQDSDGMDET